MNGGRETVRETGKQGNQGGGGISAALGFAVAGDQTFVTNDVCWDHVKSALDVVSMCGKKKAVMGDGFGCWGIITSLRLILPTCSPPPSFLSFSGIYTAQNHRTDGMCGSRGLHVRILDEAGRKFRALFLGTNRFLGFGFPSSDVSCYALFFWAELGRMLAA